MKCWYVFCEYFKFSLKFLLCTKHETNIWFDLWNINYRSKIYLYFLCSGRCNKVINDSSLTNDLNVFFNCKFFLIWIYVNYFTDSVGKPYKKDNLQNIRLIEAKKSAQKWNKTCVECLKGHFCCPVKFFPNSWKCPESITKSSISHNIYPYKKIFFSINVKFFTDSDGKP